MINYLKSQLKNIPMMILICIAFYGIRVIADSYAISSLDVTFDNTGTNITATNMQNAIDEVYNRATDFSTYNTRLTGVETIVGNSTLTTTNKTLTGAVNELNSNKLNGSGDGNFASGETFLSILTSLPNNSVRIAKAWDLPSDKPSSVSGGDYNEAIFLGGRTAETNYNKVILIRSGRYFIGRVKSDGSAVEWDELALNSKIKSSHMEGYITKGTSVSFTLSKTATAFKIYGASGVTTGFDYMYSNGYLCPVKTDENATVTISSDYKTITITNNKPSGSIFYGIDYSANITITVS